MSVSHPHLTRQHPATTPSGPVSAGPTDLPARKVAHGLTLYRCARYNAYLTPAGCEACRKKKRSFDPDFPGDTGRCRNCSGLKIMEEELSK